MDADLLAEIKAADPGGWYSGPWTTQYVDGEPSHYLVKQGDIVIATLPDWAGPLALFIAVARTGTPFLLAELGEAQTKLASAERRVEELAAENATLEKALGLNEAA